MTRSRPSRALVLGACAFSAATVLTACGVSYGANFDYPDEPPVPSGATVIATAEGYDDDDPMRGREVVIDTGSARQADLLSFYAERFPSSAGWLKGKPDPDNGGGHLLCLVSHADERFDEYVEVYPYGAGRFTSAGPHRYLVWISRLYPGPKARGRTEDSCGLASIWFPMNL